MAGTQQIVSEKDTEYRDLISHSCGKYSMSTTGSQALCWVPGHSLSKADMVPAFWELKAW